MKYFFKVTFLLAFTKRNVKKKDKYLYKSKKPLHITCKGFLHLLNFKV